MRALFVILLLSFSFGDVISAQDTTVTVPDLAGLTVPEAAALLNRAGLRLGVENNEGWTGESGLPENRISVQSAAAGTILERGAAVDITVLRSNNSLLIYDDNDLTLVNNGISPLDLTGITFITLDGSPAQLAGSRWSRSLRENQCVQVWAVGRNGPKGLDECGTIQNWLVTTNASEHFWTGSGGTTQFAVLQNGVQRAVCPVANPGRCEFFLAGSGAADEVTAYVYFAYTADRLAIINQSADRWMALADFFVLNNFAPNKGAPVMVGDPALYTTIRPDLGNVGRLAPGQCVLFTNSSPETNEPPEACDIIASLDVGPSVIFWGAAFEMDGRDGERRSCPAAAAGRLTICIMPR